MNKSRDPHGWTARMVDLDKAEETIEIRCEIPGVTDHPMCEGGWFSRKLDPARGFYGEDEPTNSPFESDLDFKIRDICLDFDYFDWDSAGIEYFCVHYPVQGGPFYEEIDALIDQWNSAPFKWVPELVTRDISSAEEDE